MSTAEDEFPLLLNFTPLPFSPSSSDVNLIFSSYANGTTLLVFPSRVYFVTGNGTTSIKTRSPVIAAALNSTATAVVLCDKNNVSILALPAMTAIRSVANPSSIHPTDVSFVGERKTAIVLSSPSAADFVSLGRIILPSNDVIPLFRKGKLSIAPLPNREGGKVLLCTVSGVLSVVSVYPAKVLFSCKLPEKGEVVTAAAWAEQPSSSSSSDRPVSNDHSIVFATNLDGATSLYIIRNASSLDMAPPGKIVFGRPTRVSKFSDCGRGIIKKLQFMDNDIVLAVMEFEKSDMTFHEMYIFAIPSGKILDHAIVPLKTDWRNIHFSEDGFVSACSSTSLLVAQLPDWYERLQSYMEVRMFREAIKLAAAYLENQHECLALDLPTKSSMLQKNLMDLAYVVSAKSSNIQDVVCLFEAFNSKDIQSSLFWELPWRSDSMIPIALALKLGQVMETIPPEQTALLLRACASREDWSQFEYLVENIPLKVIDINYTLPICSENNLHMAKSRLLTELMDDPITALLDLIGTPNAIRYLSHYLNEGSDNVKSSLYSCIFQQQNLEILLQSYAKPFLDILHTSFEDAYLNDAPLYTRQVIINVLQQFVGETSKTLVATFIANNIPKYPQYIRLTPTAQSNILHDLCQSNEEAISGTTFESRQASIESLLSSYIPEDPKMTRDLLEAAGFWKLLRSRYQNANNWSEVLSVVLADSTHQWLDVIVTIHQFDHENDNDRKAFLKAIPRLLQENLPGTVNLLASLTSLYSFSEMTYCLSSLQLAKYIQELINQQGDRVSEELRSIFLQTVEFHDAESPINFLQSQHDSFWPKDGLQKLSEREDFFVGRIWALGCLNSISEALQCAADCLSKITEQSANGADIEDVSTHIDCSMVVFDLGLSLCLKHHDQKYVEVYCAKLVAILIDSDAFSGLQEATKVFRHMMLKLETIKPHLPHLLNSIQECVTTDSGISQSKLRDVSEKFIYTSHWNEAFATNVRSLTHAEVFEAISRYIYLQKSGWRPEFSVSALEKHSILRISRPDIPQFTSSQRHITTKL